MDYELLTGRKNTNLIEYEGYLIHRDVETSFRELQLRAKDDINADLKIVSSFRDHTRQSLIWNNKALGKRKILNDAGIELDFNSLSQEDLLLSILRFSAIPGASRHHWGCDFDVFDAQMISQDNLELTHAECVGDGACAKLHSWLDKVLPSTDFYRPYEYDHGGVSVEKWHLSFKPLSTEFINQYTFDIFLKNLKESEIELKDILLQKAEFYFKQYFLNQRQ